MQDLYAKNYNNLVEGKDQVGTHRTQAPGEGISSDVILIKLNSY